MHQGMMTENSRWSRRMASLMISLRSSSIFCGSVFFDKSADTLDHFTRTHGIIDDGLEAHEARSRSSETVVEQSKASPLDVTSR